MRFKMLCVALSARCYDLAPQVPQRNLPGVLPDSTLGHFSILNMVFFLLASLWLGHLFDFMDIHMFLGIDNNTVVMCDSVFLNYFLG